MKKLAKVFYRFQKLRIFLRFIGLETNGYLVNVPKEFKPPRVNFRAKSKNNEFQFDFSNSNIQAVAAECKKETGFYPISFSFPDNKIREFSAENKKRLVSNVVPGDRYSFNSESDYYQQYADSKVAFTMKKGGWDCYRHLEIMANNCTPLFLEAKNIPKFTMVHYPKQFFEDFADFFFMNKNSVSLGTAEKLHNFFKEHLSTSSMANYVLNTCGSNIKRVLFIDKYSESFPDYMSVSTLIGLKQVLGKNCESLFDPAYLYSDFQGDTAILYGRGFGYSKNIDAGLRISDKTTSSQTDLSEEQLIEKCADFDLVILGCFEKNLEIFEQLKKNKEKLPQVAVIHGGDFQATIEQKEMLISSGFTVFVREI
jgi:hypothetical protein